MTDPNNLTTQDKGVKCAMLRGLVKYVEQNYGKESAKVFIKSTGISAEKLLDAQQWLTWEEYEHLLEELVKFTGDPDATYKAGLFASDKKSMGNMWFVLFSNMISYKMALKKTFDNMHLYMRAGEYEILELKNNKMVLKAKWHDGIKITRESCLHRNGAVAGGAKIWGLEPASCRKIRCQAEDGGDCCIEEYRWKNKHHRTYKLILPILTCIVITAFYQFTAIPTSYAIFILIISYLLGSMIDNKNSIALEHEISEGQVEELKESMEIMEQKYDELQITNNALNKAYEELFEAKKLEPLGVIAGSIAHDYGNILTSIRGYLELSSISIENSEDINATLDLLKEVEKATERAIHLTKQLLIFSKSGMPVTEVVSISEILKENVNFTLTGSNIKCIYNIDDNLAAIDVDKYQFSQVIGNLTLNAIQAMPDGGQLEVSATNITISKDFFLENSPNKAGSYVLITFKDNGIGIDKDKLHQIFDPYFTTKKTGSGLGLASCYSIIKKHDGHISVESTQEKGTTFYLYIPTTDKPITNIRNKTQRPIFGAGKVLIIDDDPSIRKLLKGMLIYLGYEVEICENMNDLINNFAECYKTHTNFDAVIIDLLLPGSVGGGEKVLARLREIDPEIKAIMTTGHVNSSILRNHREHNFEGALLKPYNITELSYVVHDVISM